jgi:hypothetical protein
VAGNPYPQSLPFSTAARRNLSTIHRRWKSLRSEDLGSDGDQRVKVSPAASLNPAPTDQHSPARGAHAVEG